MTDNKTERTEAQRLDDKARAQSSLDKPSIKRSDLPRRPDAGQVETP